MCNRPHILRLGRVYFTAALAVKSSPEVANPPVVATFKAEMVMGVLNQVTLCGNDEVHFWLNGYVNKQNCCIWSEANPQVYVETPLHPEKLTVWCALWAGGILLQKQ
ncbi:hypothetical protein TNCV_2981841 [Trichonephila clavipes]|nr:hypothetical protein TNCV_2981841 [Trichonephila clavipes]